MNTVTVPKGKKIYDGKYHIPVAWHPHHAELYLFGKNKGEKKLFHWKRFVALTWPEPIFIWDEWCELFFAALCGAKDTVERVTGKKIETEIEWWTEVIATGCASSGKSTKAGMWILGRWLCAQPQTTGVLTSTSIEMLKRRIFADLLTWIEKSTWEMPLEIVGSDTEVRWSKNDKKGAIFGRAVDDGGTVEKSVGRIKGLHNKIVVVCTDELTAMPAAIALACRNLDAGTDEFQMIGLGNATSRSDQHGLHCEPMDGWDSITVDDQFWLTKNGGCCVHFDGFKSPALREPEKFKFYVNQKKIDRDTRFYGGDRSPEFWQNIRGFWSPSGLSKTVIDDALLAQFHTSDKAIWKTGFKMGASFDVSFEGGDRKILYPFKFGEFSNGLRGIEFQPPIVLQIDSQEDKRFIHYSIADAVVDACAKYQIDGKPQPIPPENFGMDVTGEGAGVYGILSGKWSMAIKAVEFGGAADDIVVAPDRPTTYRELYANRVTMLWFVARRFIEGDQVRGLTDPETRTELTARKYEMKGGKQVVESKSKMKLSGHNSPDKGDACCIAFHILREQGITPAGNIGGSITLSLTEWNKRSTRFSVFEENNYSDSNAAFA